MRIGFKGELLDEPQVRAGFIGCGSHAWRNLFPTLQFVPVELVATCDVDEERAREFAAHFAAHAYYTDIDEMLESEDLDAVFISTGYDETNHLTHPELTVQCLRGGVHVWMEKPPATTCAEVDEMQRAEKESGKFCMTGLKSMFFPANEKAVELMQREDFGTPQLITMQRPVNVPEPDDVARYIAGENVDSAKWLLDHICHIASVLVLFGGMPDTLYYERTPSSAGAATFRYDSGLVATMSLTHGQAYNGGIERSMVVGQHGHHVLVENNIRVFYARGPSRPEGQGYGNTPNHFTGPPERATAYWEPEISLGQLYSKGLFTQGFWGEIEEFARAILEDRRPAKCHSDHIWQCTRIFEAFAEGPGKVIEL